MALVYVSTISAGVSLEYRMESPILEAADSEAETYNNAMTKLKEISIDDLRQTSCPVTLRIKYDYAIPGGTEAEFQVYRNGSPAGTAKSTTSGVYSTWEEDVEGWLVGDKIQLYARVVSGEGRALCRRLRVLGIIDNTTVNSDAFSTTLD